jgi:hypothetical protein
MRESNSRDYPLDRLQPLIDYFSPEKVRRLGQERVCMVAEADQLLIGTAALEGAELATFFVLPEYQGQGSCVIVVRMWSRFTSLLRKRYQPVIGAERANCYAGVSAARLTSAQIMTQRTRPEGSDGQPVRSQDATVLVLDASRTRSHTTR